MPAAALGTPPVGATHLLLVADPDDLIAEADEGNNVQALALPDLTWLHFDWNVNRGPGWKTPERGVNFGYEIKRADLPRNTQVAFYWASGPNFSDKIGSPLTPQDLVNTVVGKYGLFNEPAHWGPAPSMPTEATHVLMVLDPDNLIIESDEMNNVRPLPINSARAILNDSVESFVDGTGIHFTFIPGLGIGENLTLSEAEVVLGVDHFNWDQTVRPPGNYRIELWRDVQTPDGKLDVSAFLNGDWNTATYADGSPVDRRVLPQGYYPDPVVQDEPGHTWTKLYFIDNSGLNDAAYAFVALKSDSFPFYLDERDQPRGISGEWQNWSDVGGTKSATEFALIDAPRAPYYVNRILADAQGNLIGIDPPNLVVAFEQSDYYMAFRTRLVGVGRNGDLVPLNGRHTGFSWKANTTVDPLTEGYSSGGITNPVPISTSKPIPEFVSSVNGGGIFDIRFDDDTPVPGSPTAPPPAAAPPPFVPSIGNRSIAVGGSLTFTISAIDVAAPFDGVTFSLGTGSPANATIGSSSGVFSWTPSATGIFNFTVRVSDNSLPSLVTQQTFTVTVIDAANPPVAIERVAINDGSAQRSMVTSLTVTFGGEVEVQSGAFELRRQDGGLVGIDVLTSLVGGQTVAVLTFSGPDVVGGSLADGNYILTVRGAGEAGSDFIFGDDPTEAFFRRYGDVDGDGIVTGEVLIRPGQTPLVEYGGDFGALIAALGRRVGEGGYLDYLDANGDGMVDALDLTQYRLDVVRSIIQ